jgi:hypothetical protein
MRLTRLQGRPWTSRFGAARRLQAAPSFEAARITAFPTLFLRNNVTIGAMTDDYNRFHARSPAPLAPG